MSDEVALPYRVARAYRYSAGTKPEIARAIAAQTGRDEDLILLMVDAIDAFVDEENDR